MIGSGSRLGAGLLGRLAAGLLTAALVLACAEPTGTSDGDGDGNSDTGNDDAGDAGPSGSCPLEGMYDQCTLDGVEGLSYCDEIAGERVWGPCQTSPACVLGQPGDGCQICELIDGVLVVSGSPTCECEAPAVPPCAQTECAQVWPYACDDCQSFVGGGDCFSYSQGCSDPLLDCAAERPCPRVWATAQADGLSPLEDPDAATCVLSSLRDGVPGEYEILWGPMGDDGWLHERVYADGDGQVFVQWGFPCPGCANFGAVGQSGVLGLQPAAYFDACLAAPTDESLIACLVGLTSAELPDGYLPPFTTGTCTSLTPACP